MFGVIIIRNNDIETHLPAAGREKTQYKTIRRAAHLVAVLRLHPCLNIAWIQVVLYQSMIRK